MNATVLWVIAAILAIIGIVQLIQGQVILGIILFIAAAAVAPAAGQCSAAAACKYTCSWPARARMGRDW